MKLTIRHLSIRSRHELDSRVEDSLLALTGLMVIEEATVDLEHRRDQSPAYRAAIHVVTPGPDLSEEAVGHTIEQAFGAAAGQLRRRVDRKARARGPRLSTVRSAPSRVPGRAGAGRRV